MQPPEQRHDDAGREEEQQRLFVSLPVKGFGHYISDDRKKHRHK